MLSHRVLVLKVVVKQAIGLIRDDRVLTYLCLPLYNCVTF